MTETDRTKYCHTCKAWHALDDAGWKAGCVSEYPNLTPGTRYTKDGVSVDIDFVKDGEVYVRRWPKGVTTQPMFNNCIRMPVARFVEQIQDATLETRP